jgi:hypothetical protein
VTFVPKNDGSGFFENKTLLDIAPLGGLPPMAMPVAGGTPAQPAPQPMPVQAVPQPQMAPQPQPVAQPAPAQPAQAPQSAPAASNVVGDMMARQDAIEASRTRQGAVRAACEYVAAQAQAGMFEGSTDADQALRARIKDLTAYVVTGSFPDEPTNSPSAEVTPESIAASAEQVQVGVPFDTAEGQEVAAS